jgi:hypothetical protein
MTNEEEIMKSEQKEGRTDGWHWGGYLEGVDVKVKGFEAEQFNSIGALPQCAVLS